MIARKSIINEFDHLGRGSRDGFVIVVPNGHGAMKVWGDQVFETLDAANSTAARCIPTICDILPAREVIHFGNNPKSFRSRTSILVEPVDDVDARKRWFAIRVTPGFQKMARKAADAPPNRIGESVIERNLRTEGIDVYMPSFWREIRKHRSRKLHSRRYPLLVGYAFIRYDEAKGFDFVRKIDGVNSVLKLSSDGQPHAFSDTDLAEIAALAFMKEQDFKFRRHSAVENARISRREKLNTQLGRILPKGRSRTVSLRKHAEAYIDSMDVAGKARVQAIIQQLDSLEDDQALDEFREAV
ncbi:hypothetical protein DEM27_05780 [Metarhizobium album]|uniref:NusG-like N-terminal domain-containing protein n=1 Tax=Metarhizobium album TaxID=2182425 RepID=A0A2U2DV21_9HYPH|nr:transcription termination/antitermination NusG family protein [Rhizobium album]PWE57150.1 hypothetical protein DEM27_05780 [Rhizobium album]